MVDVLTSFLAMASFDELSKQHIYNRDKGQNYEQRNNCM